MFPREEFVQLLRADIADEMRETIQQATKKAAL